ncbi:MAG: hypothetical protein KDA72_15545 [Planctomycetales bacterium]|nr:hypothetical protein [Planctomycetales bacterium]
MGRSKKNLCSLDAALIPLTFSPPPRLPEVERSHTTSSDHLAQHPLLPSSNLERLPCGLEGEKPCEFRGDIPTFHPHVTSDLWMI